MIRADVDFSDVSDMAKNIISETFGSAIQEFKQQFIYEYNVAIQEIYMDSDLYERDKQLLADLKNMDWQIIVNPAFENKDILTCDVTIKNVTDYECSDTMIGFIEHVVYCAEQSVFREENS